MLLIRLSVRSDLDELLVVILLKTILSRLSLVVLQKTAVVSSYLIVGHRISQQMLGLCPDDNNKPSF